jgi:hypothetical protein
MFGGIPFEHFAHGGGGGFPGGSGRSRSSEPVDTTKLYETLEVEKTATPKEIKKSYFRLSKLHHPDKGKLAMSCVIERKKSIRLVK